MGVHDQCLEEISRQVRFFSHGVVRARVSAYRAARACDPQVFHGCADRGKLLARVAQRYAELFRMVTVQLRDARTILRLKTQSCTPIGGDVQVHEGCS